jgi:hypothetical protein
MGWVQRLGFLFTRPHALIPVGMERTLVNVKTLAEQEGLAPASSYANP